MSWRGRAALLAALTVVGSSATGGAMGSVAHAEDQADCRPSTGPSDYQARLAPLAAASEATIRQVLGAQNAFMWFSPVRQGFGVGLAPGSLTPEQAHAAIIDGLRSSFSSDDLAYFDRILLVAPQPYSESQLLSTQNALIAQLQAANLNVGWAAGYGCRLSDAVRVEVILFNDRTPTAVERVNQIIAPFGDHVRLELSDSPPPVAQIGPPGGPPPPIPAPPDRSSPRTGSPIRLGDYLVMASSRRCLRGHRLRIVPRQAMMRAAVELRISSKGHFWRLHGKRLSKPVVVPAASARTSVSLVLRLRDGTRLTKTQTFTRCG